MSGSEQCCPVDMMSALLIEIAAPSSPARSISKKASEVSAQVQEGWGHLSSDPKAWGSVLGAVNVALLGGLGYYAYKERNNNTYKWDRKTVSAISVGVLTLLGVQGYAAAETARKQQGKK